MARAGVQVGVARTGQEGSSCRTESHGHRLITEERWSSSSCDVWYPAEKWLLLMCPRADGHLEHQRIKTSQITRPVHRAPCFACG